MTGPSRSNWAPGGRDDSTPSGATVATSGQAGLDVRAFPVTAAVENCDLLKIDVEGLESVLLEACLPSLIDLRPLIMVEVPDGNTPLRAMLPELIGRLRGHVYAMGRASLAPVDVGAFALRVSLHAAYGTWDYLIVPAQRSERVADFVGDENAADQRTAQIT